MVEQKTAAGDLVGREALFVDVGGVMVPVDATNKLPVSATVDFEGDTSDLDSGAGVDGHAVVAIGVPASGGHFTITGDASGLDVDTELPAASALDDNIAGGVVVPKIAILPYRYDRTGGLFHRAAAARGLGDGIDGADSDAAATYLHNNASFDRARNNTEGTLLASAARTATVSSADQTNHNARGVIVYVNVTAVTATPSVVFTIEGKDPVGGAYKALLTATAITDVTGMGLYAFVVYPGATASAGLQSSLPLPRTWRVTATHGDADSITYSCAYALIL